MRYKRKELLIEYLVEHSRFIRRYRLVRDINTAVIDDIKPIQEGLVKEIRDFVMDEWYEQQVPNSTITVEFIEIWVKFHKDPFSFTYHPDAQTVDVYYEPFQWKKI